MERIQTVEMATRGENGTDRPRILLITDRVPAQTAGYSIRVSNVVAGLLDAGDLHVCAIGGLDDHAELEGDKRFSKSIVVGEEPPLHRRAAEAIRALPNMLYRNEPDLRKRISSEISNQEWDIVWFSRVRVYRLCADLVGGNHILDLDDLNDRLFTSLVSDRRARLGFFQALPRNLLNHLSANRWREHYRRLSTADVQLVVCHDGQRRHLGSSNAALVPNGYPAQHCLDHQNAKPRTCRQPRILFVGSLKYEPNYLAVRWFIDEVLDRIRASIPEVQLSVVGELGKGAKSLQHDAVTLHGFVPNVQPYYDKADLAVAPLHSGGGTRVKVLEAMARRCPIVATPFACEGLGVTPGEDLSVAQSADEFAAECVGLLSHRDLATELADRALATFTAHHRAKQSSAAVTEIVLDVLGRADDGGSAETD